MGLTDLPVARRREHIAAFGRAGFEVVPGRGKGSHVVLRKPGHPSMLVLPKGVVKRTVLAAQIKQAGLTPEEYVRLFRS